MPRLHAGFQPGSARRRLPYNWGMPRKRTSVLPLLILTLTGAAAFAQQAPSGLKIEYLENPVGIDILRPRFSWLTGHADRGQKQTAYQIVVSLKPEVKVGDQWDSGRVESVSSINAVYNGKPLESGQIYYWQVRWWDKAGKPSPYSGTASFETGLLGAKDWKGKWIGRDEASLYKNPSSPYWNLAKARWIWAKAISGLER